MNEQVGETCTVRYQPVGKTGGCSDVTEVGGTETAEVEERPKPC